MNPWMVLAVALFLLGLWSLCVGISQMETQEQNPLTPSDLDRMTEQDRMDHIERWR